MEIRIKNGEIRFVYSDDLSLAMKEIGSINTKRASHVEPDGNGNWAVDLTPVGGPVIKNFKRRDEALAAEVDWLLENKIPQPL